MQCASHLSVDSATFSMTHYMTHYYGSSISQPTSLYFILVKLRKLAILKQERNRESYEKRVSRVKYFVIYLYSSLNSTLFV